MDVFTKQAWVKIWKDKTNKRVLNAFIQIVTESNCKSNKLWIDQGIEFYNKLMQGWLSNNDVLIHSTRNKSKVSNR